jgi:excisionase family DNA binding protein
MDVDTRPQFYTPPEVAKLLRCRESKISNWIRSGVLQAVNVGEGRRPRFRIAREHLDAFLQAKAVVPPPPKPVRRERREVPRYV